jgi:putative transcriptional regulator
MCFWLFLCATGIPWAMKNKVKVFRAGKDWSQQELAEAVGVSRQTINAIEQGKYAPSLPLALALARTFATSVEMLFDEGAA